MSVLTWNTPVSISGPTASDPHVVIDLSGNCTAVWVEQNVYNTGTASQSGTTITGSGTVFTSSMVGGTLVYANGITVSITAFVNSTTLTTSTSLTVSSQSYNIYYNGFIKTSTLPFGGSWSLPIQLSTSGDNSLTPRIGIDSNNIISVVWEENNVINYASYNGTWSSVVTISSSTGASNPSIAVDSAGDIAVVWTQSGNTNAITKPISTGLWSSITTFSTVSNSDHPNVAIGGGIITAIWHAKPSTQDEIFAATATVTSGSFGTPVNLVVTSTGHMHNYPKVAVDTFGNSIAVWYRSDLGGSTNTDYINVMVLASTLSSGASSWGIPVTVSYSSYGMMNPANLTIKCSIDLSGNAYILMTTSTYGNDFNIEANIRQVSGILSGSYVLIDYNLTAFATDISISPLSDVLVVYTYYDGTNCDIQAVETDIGGYPVNYYTAPSNVSNAGTNNSQPRGAITIVGSTVNAVVVWQNYDSSSNTTLIQAATGSKSLLGPPTGLTVNQTTNNFGVFNEFDNNLFWTASTDPNVAGYNIYRDNIFILQVGSGTTNMVDNNRVQTGTGTTVTYSVASFDNYFQQSQRVITSIS